MGQRHSIFRTILELFLDLLVILGVGQYDPKQGWSRRRVVVTLLAVLVGVSFVVGLLAGWIPWRFVEIKGAIHGGIAVTVLGLLGTAVALFAVVAGCLAAWFEVRGNRTKIGRASCRDRMWV